MSSAKVRSFHKKRRKVNAGKVMFEGVLLGAFDSYCFEWGTARHKAVNQMSDPDAEVYKEYSDVMCPEKRFIKEMVHRSFLDLCCVNEAYRKSAIQWFTDSNVDGEGLYMTFYECCDFLGYDADRILARLESCNFCPPTNVARQVRSLR